MSSLDKSKPSSKNKKIIFNLKDVSNAKEFTQDLPFWVHVYCKIDSKFSMFMIENAQVRAERHNYFLKESKKYSSSC